MASFTTLDLLLIAYSLIAFILLSLTALISFAEGEKRAAKRALIGSLIAPIPFLLLFFFSFPGSHVLAWIFLSLISATVLLLILPIPSPFPHTIKDPQFRIDERDTMFSRNELKSGNPDFAAYYRANPDKKPNDDAFRKKPGLMGQNAQFYDPFFFGATQASFSAIDGFHQSAEPQASLKKQQVKPDELVKFIKAWMKHSGAHSVGVTDLKPVHLYSYSGRGKRYGQAVDCQHKSAIALTVEMNSQMIACGPDAPTLLESADQYLRAATLAVKLAGFLAELGYSSRAHIDADYLVVCPLVARDAGLGEIGRMGLLMTPDLGPRVRLAVVTTELSLPVDPRKPDHTMSEFCQYCEKCATVCPSQAIPKGPMIADENGIVRWKIDQERCFSYWCQTGTDCGRCIALCPYSHKNNLMHNSIRFLIRYAYFFRRYAALFDDLLYGSKPPPKSDCGWKLNKQGELK